MDVSYIYEKIIQRIEQIEYNRDYYQVFLRDNLVRVTYCGNPFVLFSSHETLMLEIKNDADWVDFQDKCNMVVIAEKRRCFEKILNYMSLEEALDKYLPLGNKVIVSEIETILENFYIKEYSVLFDTHSNTYIISCDLSSYIFPDTIERPKKIFKYISFETLFCILTNRTYRLNSGVSMNDINEYSYLYNILLGEMEECDKFRFRANKSNYLMSSFSLHQDDALMWRLYGANGTGACLVIKDTANNIKPIIYLDERNMYQAPFKNLRLATNKLREKNIHFYFEDIDKYCYFVKSSDFSYESEWRLLKNENTNLQYALYSGLISPYRDYLIEKGGFIPDLGIQISEIILGDNVSHFETNYPLIVKLACENIGVSIVNRSSVKGLR